MKPAQLLQTLIPLTGLLLMPLSTLAEDADAAPSATTPSENQPSTVNRQLSALISSHRYQEAWALASSAAADMEGDATFDFNYGFSAAQTGHFYEALFPFERLVAEYPDVPRYRLELARAYFQLGNPDAAEEQFLLVKASNPPSQVSATIDGFLKKIAEEKQMIRPSWSGFVTLSGGYDTNYNSATDTEQIELYNGAFQAELNSDNLEKSGSFYQLRAQTNYISPLSMRSAWDVQLGASRKDNSADNVYDLDNAYATAGMRFLRGQHNLHTGLRLNRYWLGGDTLMTEYSLNNDWRYSFDDWMLKGALNLRSQDNALNDELDLDQLELQLGGAWAGERSSLQSILILATDQADAEYQARNTFGLNLSGQYLLSKRSSLYSSLIARGYRFKDEYPDTNAFAAGVTRNDSMVQFTAGFGQTLQSWLTLYVQVSYIDYISNIELYEYDRTLSEAGLTLSF